MKVTLLENTDFEGLLRHCVPRNDIPWNPTFCFAGAIQPRDHHLSSFVQTAKPREALLVVGTPGLFEPRDTHSIVSIELVAIM